MKDISKIFCMTCLRSQAGFFNGAQIWDPRPQNLILVHFLLCYVYFVLSQSTVSCISGHLGCETQGLPRDFYGVTEPWQTSKWVLFTIYHHLLFPRVEKFNSCVSSTSVSSDCFLFFRIISVGGQAVQACKFWTSQAAEAGTSGHKALERRRGMEGRWRKGKMMPLALRGRYIFVTIRDSE